MVVPSGFRETVLPWAGLGLVGAVAWRVRGEKFAVGIWVFLLIFTLHTVLWWRGWFGSCGLMRILACVGPITAIVCLQGWNGVAGRMGSWGRGLAIAGIGLTAMVYYVVDPLHQRIFPLQAACEYVARHDLLRDAPIIIFGDPMVQAALKMRPDLAAVEQGRSAQAEAVSAAKWSFGPRVSTYGNWEEDQPSWASSGGNNWVAGVQIGIDILPLGKRAQLARETAAKARVDAQARSYEQQIRMQVSRAYIQEQTAKLSLETAHAAIDQATESLRILRNRYSAGLATVTDLLRAEDAERETQSNYWHAVYGNALAHAQLLFATGTLTPDAAEDLQ